MIQVVLKRTVLFLTIVFVWAQLAAVYAQAATAERGLVPFQGFAPGSIVVKTGERRLYFVVGGNRAIRFPVGVGRRGQAWTGRATIEGKFIRPAWAPPDDIRREHPNLPEVIAGGDAKNPMGEAALTMRSGKYAIHGTNNPASVGGYVSHGCFRMYNSDIQLLYSMVEVGAPVIVER